MRRRTTISVIGLLEELTRIDYNIAIATSALAKGGDLNRGASAASKCELKIFKAAAEGDIEMLESLLAKGRADVCDADLNTPLHHAVIGGSAQAVVVLLQHGARLDIENANGDTPRSLAQKLGNNVMASLLVQVDQSDRRSPTHPRQELGTIPDDEDEGDLTPTESAGLVIIMVGVSARGKTYVRREISRYLSWHGRKVAVLSHRDFRMAVVGERTTLSADEEGIISRSIAQEMKRIMSDGPVTIILDGTHLTRCRRGSLHSAILSERICDPQSIIFLERYIDDMPTLRRNCRAAARTMDVTEEQYMQRCEEQMRIYNPLSPSIDSQLTFIRIINNSKLHFHRVSGRIGRVGNLLGHLRHRSIRLYLATHGQAEDAERRKNETLTASGRVFRNQLFNYISGEMKGRLFSVKVGTSGACLETAAPFVEAEAAYMAAAPSPMVSTRAEALEESDSEHESFGVVACRVGQFSTLDDIKYGDCEGFTTDEIMSVMPKTYETIIRDPYNTAWPNGESVRQVFETRLEQHILDILSSSHPILIITHPLLIRGLVAYFVHPDTSGSEAMNLPHDNWNVIRVTRSGGTMVSKTVSLLAQELSHSPSLEYCI